MENARRIPRRPGLPDQVAERIRQDILDGQLKAGERLPSEHELCDTYGVSRPVVREAISQLKYDGLVVSQQGRGVFVAEDGGAKTLRLEFDDIEDQQELAHIIELLVAVEGSATALAAQRRSKADVRALAAQLAAMRAAVESGASGVEEDVAFHQTIARMTGNPFFVKLGQFIDGQVRNFILRARSNTARIEGLAHEVQEEHEAIYTAIADGDPDAARQAAERHLRGAARRLRLYISGA